jgi:hypothetical protein
MARTKLWIPLLAVGTVLISSAGAFFVPAWCWTPIILFDAFLFSVFFRQSRQALSPPNDLSNPARELWARFGTFYAAPSMGSSFAVASNIVALGGCLPGMICLTRGGAALGVAVAVGNYLVMTRVGLHFDPTRLLRTPAERAAHDELLARLR